MRKLPPDLPGMSEFERRILEDALMFDKALGPRGLDALQAYHAEQDLIEKLAHPERDLVEQHLQHMSGASIQHEAMKAAAGPGFELDRALRQPENLTGAVALQRAAEGLVGELSGAEALRRAAAQPTWRELEVARQYETFDSIAKQHSAIESIWKAALGRADSLEDMTRAMKINQPWIDAIEPARSFAAYGALSEIGRAIKSLEVEDPLSSQRLSTLLGSWTPPEGFAQWDESQRLAAYRDADIDMRIFDIPRPAFEDVAREAGIVQPAPEIKGEPTEPAKPKVSRVSIPFQGSINLDAHAQVQSVELMLRHELGWRAATKHGPKWMKTFIHGSVLAELKVRQTGARVGKSPSLLDFTTFGELIQVIQRKDLWESAFSDLPLTREEFRVSVERLMEARNAVDHGRELDPWEFISVFAEATRLQRAFGIPPFTAEES